MRFCAAAPPNENRSLSCGFAATSAVSTNEIATFIAACTRVQYRYKNRAKICTSPQHIPLYLFALKFTHRLPQRCFHCAASQLCIANCHKIALKFTHRRSRSATAVPRYIAPPYQLRRRMKIAIRLALLSPCHATHRSGTVSLNKITPLYHNTADKNRTEIYARISVRIYASYRKNRKI